MIKKWLNTRMKERTSWDGAAPDLTRAYGIVYGVHC